MLPVGWVETSCCMLSADSPVPCVGASGAISGVVGAYLVLLPQSKFDLEVELGLAHLATIKSVRIYAVLPIWLAWQALFAFGWGDKMPPSFSLWVNVGGFCTGILLAVLFARLVPEEKRRTLLETQSNGNATTFEL